MWYVEDIGLDCKCFEAEAAEVLAFGHMDQAVIVFAPHRNRCCEKRKRDALTVDALIEVPARLGPDIVQQNS